MCRKLYRNIELMQTKLCIGSINTVKRDEYYLNGLNVEIFF